MKYDMLIKDLADDKSIALQKDMENYVFGITVYPKHWIKYFKTLKSIPFEWNIYKYDSDSLPEIEPNTKGIYLFVVKPPSDVVDTYSIVLYVGISEEGLLERLTKGYLTPSKVKERPHVHRMIVQYGEFLYWYYCAIDEKKYNLKVLEKNLIGYFCTPPINRKDEPSEIAKAKKSRMF